MISGKKKSFLSELGIDVDALDKGLETAAAELTAAGVESKETDEADAETEPTENETESADETAEQKDETAADAELETETETESDEIPMETIVAAAVQVGVESALASVSGELKALSDRIVALEKGAADLDEMTPASATFADVLRSAVIGSDAAKVDGRTKEGKDAPVENPNKAAADSSFFPVVDLLKTNGDWRAAVAHKMADAE